MLGLDQSPVWSYCLSENDAHDALPHPLQNRRLKHLDPPGRHRAQAAPVPGRGQFGSRACGYRAAERSKAVACLLDGEGFPFAQGPSDPTSGLG